MPYTLKLDALRHDLLVRNGKLVLLSGSEEVRQRVKVALWHELGEYFLNPDAGIPWHSEILGKKLPKEQIVNTVRNAISKVPGVLRVLSVESSQKGREYAVDAKISVKKGENEVGDGIVEINGIIGQ